MQELVDKIQEFTRDGSPSVGQWIELGDLSKKYGVRKFEMEKMVEEALKREIPPSQELKIDEKSGSAENSNEKYGDSFKYNRSPSFERDNVFDRPNFELNRDKFEEEMLNRRVQENRMFEREATPEIDQPEVVFPELKVEFDGPIEQVDFKEEKVELVNEDSILTSIDPVEQEDFKAPKFFETEFKVEPVDPQIEFEDISTTKFDEKPEEFETRTQFNTIAEYIEESNKRTLRETKEREEKERIREQKAAKQNKEKQQRQQQQQSAQRQRKRDASIVSHAEAKKARTVGIVAAITGLLFGFVGIFIGLYGLNLNNKLKKEIDESSNLYGDQIKQYVSVGRGLSLAGIIIGSIRLFNSLSDIFL